MKNEYVHQKARISIPIKHDIKIKNFTIFYSEWCWSTCFVNYHQDPSTRITKHIFLLQLCSSHCHQINDANFLEKRLVLMVAIAKSSLLSLQWVPYSNCLKINTFNKKLINNKMNRSIKMSYKPFLLIGFSLV